MFGWFSKRTLELSYDIHSHLLPGLDDGVRSFEESIEILRFFESKGIRRAITTPHVYRDVYPNSEKAILDRLEILRQKIAEAGIGVEVSAGAEYFLDDTFHRRLKDGNSLLAWEQNHLLFETSFYNRPLFFDEAVFDMKAAGYIPVLAHPERYHYLERDLEWLTTRIHGGLKVQVNLLSLAGGYGPTPRKIAQLLLRESLVSFLGSDIHRASQIALLSKSLTRRIVKDGLQNAR